VSEKEHRVIEPVIGSFGSMVCTKPGRITALIEHSCCPICWLTWGTHQHP
jgi:hypothetical protein